MALGMEVGLGPVHVVIDGHTAPLPKKETEPPIFGPSLVWPNGWMHQDTTWNGGRPQLRRPCVDGDPVPVPQKGRSHTQFSAHFPDDLVLDGDPVPVPQKGRSHTQFRPTSIVANGCMDQDATWYGGRPLLRDIVLDVLDPATPPLKGHRHPIFGQCPLWPNGRMDYDAT